VLYTIVLFLWLFRCISRRSQDFRISMVIFLLNVLPAPGHCAGMAHLGWSPQITRPGGPGHWAGMALLGGSPQITRPGGPGHWAGMAHLCGSPQITRPGGPGHWAGMAHLGGSPQITRPGGPGHGGGHAGWDTQAYLFHFRSFWLEVRVPCQVSTSCPQS
jgi:hypothetical protein